MNKSFPDGIKGPCALFRCDLTGIEFLIVAPDLDALEELIKNGEMRCPEFKKSMANVASALYLRKMQP